MSDDEFDPAGPVQSGPQDRLGLEFIQEYPYLQFPERSLEQRRALKYVRMAHARQKCIDWELLEQLGERARAEEYIGGDDSPWFQLFDIDGIPHHRELTVEFLSTFTFRHRGPDFVEPPAGQPEAPPEVSFSIFGEVQEMDLARFAVLSGLYWEPQTVTPMYTEALTSLPRDELVVFWSAIADSPVDEGGKARATGIRDPLFRYLHKVVATSGVAARGQSTEWCTPSDMFYLCCLLERRPCQLAYCLAAYFGSYHSRKISGKIFGGSFVTVIARRLDRYHQHVQGLSLPILPQRLGLSTMRGMGIVGDFGADGIRLIGRDGHVWVAAPFPMPPPIQAVPVHFADEQDPIHHQEQQQPQGEGDQPQQQQDPLPRPRRQGRAVRVVRLPAATQQAIVDIQAAQTTMARRMDRVEDLIEWLVRESRERSRAAGVEPAPLPARRRYPGDEGAGPSGDRGGEE